MSLLKNMVKEMAAAGSISAHSAAGVPNSLFGGGVVDGKRSRRRTRRGKNRKMIKRVTNMTEGYVVVALVEEIKFSDLKRGQKFKKANNPNLVLTKTSSNKFRKNLTKPRGGAVNFKIDPTEIVIKEGLGASSGETDFSSSDVVSKLDAQEKKAKAGDDTTAFGMEDEDGNLVKVYVRTESAEDFEKALANMLAGEDENDDDANTALEIAEVLFKLKDKFEIVDVEWPEIEGDEEEEQEMEGGEEGGEGDLEGDLEGGDKEGGEGGDDLDIEGGDEEGGEGDLEGEGGDMEADDDGAKGALDKVIDMMKADAEAKKAEAEARKAEANAKEADAVARASQAKVTQEEQVLDMEAYYKDKADVDKEAKQLAKMAKFRHDKAKEAEGMLANESVDNKKKDNDPYRYNDDEDEDDKELNSEELATLIYKNLRAN